MDEIRITNLEVFCHHGVFVEENTLGQKFLVSAILYTDTRRAGIEDDLKLSINYGEICHRIKVIMEERNYKLIETVAETVAKRLLTEYETLQEIELEIKKPWAPIMLPIEMVSVRIRRGWHRVVLGLGSNIGDKKAHLDYALSRIEALETTKNCKISSYLKTKPYGGVEQDDFLNACMTMDTLLNPNELLDVLHEIENERARTREIHWGPRTLDLDILYYDQEIIDTDVLTVPHPEIEKREFVLKPLLEIAPNLRNPITRKTTRQMLDELN